MTATPPEPPRPFPRTFYFANAIELTKRNQRIALLEAQVHPLFEARPARGQLLERLECSVEIRGSLRIGVQTEGLLSSPLEIVDR